MGKCECMYAALPDGNGCTLCRIPCGPLAECDEKGTDAKCQCKFAGTFPHCKKVDCQGICGPGSGCVKKGPIGSKHIVCTSCATDRVLWKAKCLLRGTWARWGTCSVTCGSGFKERRQICPGNVRQCYKKKKKQRTCNMKNCPIRTGHEYMSNLLMLTKVN